MNRMRFFHTVPTHGALSDEQKADPNANKPLYGHGPPPSPDRAFGTVGRGHGPSGRDGLT